LQRKTEKPNLKHAVGARLHRTAPRLRRHAVRLRRADPAAQTKEDVTKSLFPLVSTVSFTADRQVFLTKRTVPFVRSNSLSKRRAESTGIYFSRRKTAAQKNTARRITHQKKSFHFLFYIIKQRGVEKVLYTDVQPVADLLDRCDGGAVVAPARDVAQGGLSDAGQSGKPVDGNAVLIAQFFNPLIHSVSDGNADRPFPKFSH